MEAPRLVFVNSTSSQKLAVNCRNINWRSGKKLLFIASDPIWTRKRTCQNGHARNIPPARTLPRGGHWDFPFRPIFRSVFHQKASFFGLQIVSVSVCVFCSISLSISGFRKKNKIGCLDLLFDVLFDVFRFPVGNLRLNRKHVFSDFAYCFWLQKKFVSWNNC